MAGTLWSAVADLVLPVECAGCRASHEPLRRGACARCAAELSALRPFPARPDPPPAGLPDCVAVGAYEGPLRQTILSYKERRRSGLAAPLGEMLAEAVARAAGGAPRAVLLVPVPATAEAARVRRGDHMRRLAARAARRLRRAGWPAAVACPLRALPKPDAAGLDAARRAAVAQASFRVRPGRVPRTRAKAAGRAVIVVDDIVTTGSTLAAVTTVLAAQRLAVDGAAVLAATRRRHPG
jgi:predicted amidophosphoribosyltransferase